MNKIEHEMLEIVRHGADAYGMIGVKAEFEAEGTRTDELLRLVEIARRANVKLAVKIGGCEAMRDLLEAKQIGVDYIIAPMIESPYALSKFIAGKRAVFSQEVTHDTDFLFNLETETGFANRVALCDLAATVDGADGVVFGRVDFSESYVRIETWIWSLAAASRWTQFQPCGKFAKRTFRVSKRER